MDWAKTTRKTKRKSLKFWDLVCIILEMAFMVLLGQGYCVMTFPARNSHMIGMANPKPGACTGAEMSNKKVFIFITLTILHS